MEIQASIIIQTNLYHLLHGAVIEFCDANFKLSDNINSMTKRSGWYTKYE